MNTEQTNENIFTYKDVGNFGKFNYLVIRFLSF